MRTFSCCLALLFVAIPVSAGEAEIRARLAESLPGISVDAVEPSSIPGLWEVTVGPRVVYVSPDGRYLVQGRVLDLETESDVTEIRQRDARVAWLDGLDESRMIIFEPEGDTRHTITVFTDIDCSYCRAFHAEIDRTLAAGIRVRYLFYPRTGPGTTSAQKADAVWCSADRRSALTRAKAGERVTAPECGKTPVMAHLNLGQAIGVTGTPMIVTDSGTLIPGYVPTAQLLEELESHRAARTARLNR